jgi:hypothetical protein
MLETASLNPFYPILDFGFNQELLKVKNYCVKKDQFWKGLSKGFI